MLKHRFAKWGLASLAIVANYTVQAVTDRYDYDGLGRLIRYVDNTGRVFEYDYDAAGNILAVRVAGVLAAPTISSVTPNALRKGEAARFTVTGSGFAGARLTSSDNTLDVSDITQTASSIAFSLHAGDDSIPGSKSFSITHAAGSANFSLTLNPTLPVLAISPQPIAVPPDSAPRRFNLVLSNPDTISHTVNLAIANTSLATVSPSSVNVAPGTENIALQLTGKAGGVTSLNISSPTLASLSVPVFVTAEFTGVLTSYAPPVGVQLGESAVPVSTTFTPIASSQVGITIGNFVSGISPKALRVGETQTLTITGSGLNSVSGISFDLADGITVGTLTRAADGKSITAPVTVASSAPQTLRRVLISGSSSYPLLFADANQIGILAGSPSIDSIDPINATPGTSALGFTIRGRNLQQASAVNFPAESRIHAASSFTVNSEGSEINAAIELPLSSPPGTYPVTVTTPTGTSSASLSVANSFSVVNEITSLVTPVLAPVVGVKLDGGGAASLSGPLFANNVNVLFGRSVSQVNPAGAAQGQTSLITLNGNDLAGLTSVQITPNTGLTVSAPSVAADGKSASFNLTVAADAVLGARALTVLAGSSAVPFSRASDASFAITAPTPRVDSVTPIVLLANGSTQNLIVRGANLQSANAVRIEPAAGIGFSGSPVANSDGSELSIGITVAGSAALGNRTLIVESIAGSSNTAGTPANTVQVVASGGNNYANFSAPLVGVVLSSPATPTAIIDGPLTAASVGVVLADTTTTPPSVSYQKISANVGVSLGNFARSLSATALYPGQAGVLTVQGMGLNAVTSASVVLPNDVSLGSLSTNAEGTQLNIPIAVAGTAMHGPRRLALNTSSGVLSFVPGNSDQFGIGVSFPLITSIEPILGERGQDYSLLIRGNSLQYANSVSVEPTGAIDVISTPIVNSAGTQATVSLRVRADAALGTYVIRIHTPGGISTGTAEPANSFTVFK